MDFNYTERTIEFLAKNYNLKVGCRFFSKYKDNPVYDYVIVEIHSNGYITIRDLMLANRSYGPEISDSLVEPNWFSVRDIKVNMPQSSVIMKDDDLIAGGVAYHAK